MVNWLTPVAENCDQVDISNQVHAAIKGAWMVSFCKVKLLTTYR